MLHKTEVGNENEALQLQQLANTYSSGKEKWLKVSCVKSNNEELRKRALQIKWEEKIVWLDL